MSQRRNIKFHDVQPQTMLKSIFFAAIFRSYFEHWQALKEFASHGGAGIFSAIKEKERGGMS